MSWKKLFRRKIIDRNEVSTELHRVLSTLDLTLLGIGSTLGTGIYVLAGQVAKMDAGPAVVISFLVAAIASVLAGLCYAEFGARVPKAGSAYVYSYVCVGEIIAFIVGWNLVMEYVIGVASVSKAYSGYVDTMIPEHAMSKFFREIGEIHVSFLGEYFDFFAFGITAVLTLLLMFGVKESSLFNNFFTVLNLLVMFFVIIAGGLYSNIDNWAVDPKHAMECKNVTPYKTDTGLIGTGGFTPFGFSGIMAGAATCFYGFIGFDVIATTGEEAKNPRRAIPISIVISLLFIFIAYFGISTVLTMMVPYYCQYGEAPLPYAFEYNGFTVGKMVVNIGALFALATSLLGSMFPMPRIIYSMARDGLLFNFLAKVHPRFQTPIWATLIGGLLGALMGALFNLSALIDMMSIGTLTAYTLVALCVLMLRYRKDEQGADDTGIDDSAEPVTLKMWFRQIFNLDNAKVPTKLSTQYTTSAVIIYCILCFAFCGTAILSEQLEGGLTPEVIALLGVFGVLLFLELVSLSLQPISRLELTFKVPLVPWIPGLSILVNTYLILELSWATWVRFAIWMVVGLVIYLYCLLTGRADTTYEASYQEFQNNAKNSKRKLSLQGIDNPALVYDAQDEHGTMHKEKPQSKNKSDKEKDSESKKEPKTAEEVPITKAKSILVNSQQRKVRDSTQKSGAPPVKLVSASPGFEDEILKIHESNQKYMNERDGPEAKLRTPEDVVDSVIAKAIQEAQAIVTNYPQEASKLVNHVVTLAEQQQSLQKIHRACQDCLNESNTDKSQPLLSSQADREETQLFLQDHLRKSFIKSPVVPPQENQENGNEISDAGNVNKMEDPSKRLEYIHMVAQLCLNGVNLESVPWPLNPPNSKNNDSAPSLKPANAEGEKEQSPELITAIMDQLRQNGVNLESVPWPIEATSQATSHPTNPAHSESKSDIDRINTIAQLSPNGVNIESIPWPIEPVLSTEVERELTKDLTKQLEIEPEKSKETPPLFTAEQLTQVLRVHDEAQKTLNEKAEEVSKNSAGEGREGSPEDPADVNKNNPESVSTKGQGLLDLHKIAQLSINGGNIESVSSQVATNNQAPSSSDPNILVVEAQGDRIVPEGAPAGIKSNAEIIHAIAQLCLQGINIDSVPWLDPVLSSSTERDEIKGLNQRMLKNSKQAPAEENAQPQTEASQSAEQITELLEIHNAAQEVLRTSPSQNKEIASTNPEDTSSTSNENRSEPLESESERIHKINELCLSGISVPWLRPILSSNEEKEQIKELNRRATAEAFRKPVVKIPAQGKDPAPRSSHDVQADMENLARIHHNIAQESLGNNSSEDSGTVADVDFDTERPSSSQSDHNSSQMKEPLYVKNKNKARETARKKISTVSFHESPKVEEIVIPRNSGSEDDEPEEEEDIPKRRLQYRRPTGPFLPHLNKLNLDKQSDLSEDDDDDEENDEDFNTSRNSNSETESSSGELEKSGTDASDNSYPLKANEEPQVATPRKQSIQNKKPMDDLIAIFEQGK